MRFLFEKSILTDEQEAEYKSIFPRDKKYEFIRNIVKTHSNAKNTGRSSLTYVDSIAENGFDTNDNKLLIFMQHVPKDLDRDTVELVKTLLDNGQLDPNQRWLYKPSLYTETDKDIAFKIKALTYASNKNLQNGADKKITPETFMNKNQVLPVESIRNILGKITVTQQNGLTAENAINSVFGTLDLTKNFNIQKVKKAIIDLISSHNKFTNNMANEINTMNIENLLKIPVKNTTANGLRVAIINYLLGKTQLVGEKTVMTGEDVLKQILRVRSLTFEKVVEYIKKLLPNETKDLIIQDVRSGKYDTAIEKVLSNKVSSAMGRRPIDVLNALLLDIFKDVKINKIDDRTSEEIAQQSYQDKLKTNKLTGLDVLKQKLNITPETNEIWQEVREYVKNILPNSNSNFAVVQKELIDSGDLDDEFDKILDQKISSATGRDLLTILNKQLINAVTDVTNKSLKGNK